ncbi:MAG: ATP-grasp domain-containing protein [Fimbriimonadaceae bacterium]|nr:ATP-grasp domain-containing protein [Fimbriimonadaceae bacterium]
MKSLFVANRGEIAVRIIRTAREMGLRTVLGSSEADLAMPAARLADEVVLLGPPPPGESYLRGDRVIEAALTADADAIHPGYGFLSESSAFSRAVREAGLIFVGPPPEAMDLLGSKSAAKALARGCGVSLVPGFFEPGATDEQLIRAAAEIGFPVMVKAAAGGGGRGMRAVHSPDDLPRQLRLAREEAKAGFGDDEMMVERLIERPRHIELQIMADAHGRCAVLFERDCTLQRRHQKLIEEAPAPDLPVELFEAMRRDALSLVEASGYIGAGTVEFIVDADRTTHAFLEVNARLQVEHPVTEMITGLDLVRLQLEIAAGHALSLPDGLLSGDRASICGHSIEVRIVAEDPAAGFLPSTGVLGLVHPPEGPGLRWDSGFETGSEVTRHYDSLIGKLIVHGPTREAARLRVVAALKRLHILGVNTNISHAIRLLESDRFLASDLDVGLIEREFGAEPGPEPPEWLGALSAAAGASAVERPASGAGHSAWAQPDSFRILGSRMPGA